jgi:hypothetical protein
MTSPQLDRLRDTQQRMDYLDDLPGLVEDYLRDLPQLIAYPVRKRDEDAAEAGLRIYRLTPDTAQPRPEVDQEAMGQKYRGLYDDLKLKAVRTADGLEITWGFGLGVSTKCASPRCTESATTSSSSTPRRRRTGISPPSPGTRATGTLESGRTGYWYPLPPRSPT